MKIHVEDMDEITTTSLMLKMFDTDVKY